MESLIVAVFVLGYLAIAFEHNIKIDKIVPALGMMAVIWALMSIGNVPVYEVNPKLLELEPANIHDMLLHHLGKTAEILMFLIGAMTIVEIIDYFDGFSFIKSLIKTTKKAKLLWIMTTLAFFLSAVIDNLTATIVLITILQKIIDDRKLKFWYVGLIVIAANAGGAWSPIGDVTTTMLWIAGKVTAVKLIQHIFIASVLCYIIPTFVASRFPVFRGELDSFEIKGSSNKYGRNILIIGLLGIVFVPIFKTVTHLPPYLGIAFSLSVVCFYAEMISGKFALTTLGGDDAKLRPHVIHHSLSKIETSSILFFFGILMAVAALESAGDLFHFAEYLDHIIPDENIVIMILGVASAIIDNVPLVAAGIGMFTDPVDSPLWHLLAFSSGTGGSILIIGSAAGVIAMGMEKIEFFTYLKNISLLAILGFTVGYGYMVFQHAFLF